MHGDRLFACVVFLVALFLLPQSSRATEQQCPQTSAFELRIIPIHGEVKYDLTKTLAEIEREAGPAVSEKHYPLLGMALQGFGLTYEVQAGATMRNDGLFCAFLKDVEMRVGWADRTVFVAKEATTVDCVYKEALDHQLRHIGLEDDALDAFIPSFSRELRALLVDLKSAPYESAELARKQLTDTVVALSRGLLGHLERERRPRRETVESPEELDRIRKACGGIEERLREAGTRL